ncbi:aquaporin-like protein, putative [Trypanosoma cruzi]|uniref:Aquaporin-like protein, putative n=2 Tax=Trypanosoma cruzi TaxID=5693 RepID=Q4DNM8_TRYCC|nr:aquaporin-like protein, putative [Trypanosoma cruzi]EAN94139.1 aquaporin-like protein, putative [Trypanosoma cruzi]|eukprot:XP_815990.1 aquaporin-like protein [Trypanosoma cruzi strain CL Brener]
MFFVCLLPSFFLLSLREINAMPKSDSSPALEKPRSTTPQPAEPEASNKNKYTDPLDLEDNEIETVEMSTKTQAAVHLPPRTLQQESPEACTAHGANTVHALAAGVPAYSGGEENDQNPFHKGKREISTTSQLTTSASAIQDSATEPDGKKFFISVEVTSDGVTRLEELDPRELARLYAQQQAALRSISGEFDILYVPDWVRLHPLLGSYVAEAFGTFACVLTLSLVSVRNQSLFDRSNDTNMTALPIGFMFMCMVFTFGYISGGHFNPAVTMAVFLVRKLDFVRAVGYTICQTGASLGAGLVAMAIQGGTDIFVPYVDKAYVSSGIFSELIFTFAIATVVLNVAYSRQSGNFFYGFAIGMTVAAGSASVGRISGGAFNPAAATGLQLALCLTGNCEPLASFWIYWMAPLVGSALAALLYANLSQPENTRALTDAAVLRADSAANGVAPVQ